MPQDKPMQPGDIVQLKSGGPALTVIAVEGDQVRCLFFSDEIGDFREASIPGFALDIFEFAEIEGEDDDLEDVEAEEDEIEDDKPSDKKKGKR